MDCLGDTTCEAILLLRSAVQAVATPIAAQATQVAALATVTADMTYPTSTNGTIGYGVWLIAATLAFALGLLILRYLARVPVWFLRKAGIRI